MDRIHPRLLSNEELEIAVVIDVLRATTTAAALLSRGASAVEIVATPDDLRRLPPPSAGSWLIFSELDAARAYDLECVDNSPALAEQIPLAQRAPVLVTTNGSRAIDAAMGRARAVLLAAFVNVSAVAHFLRLLGRRVTILPAGDFVGAEPRTEDERCADALTDLVEGRQPDFGRLIADCRADPRVQRRLTRHPELERDLAVAFMPDRYDAVAVVTNHTERAGRSARRVETIAEIISLSS